MSEYSIALERQLELLRYIEQSPWPDDAPNKELIAELKYGLEFGESFYVSDAIAGLLFTAAGDTGIFSFVLHKEDVPAPSGFVYMQSNWELVPNNGSPHIRDGAWVWTTEREGLLLVDVLNPGQPKVQVGDHYPADHTGFNFFFWKYGTSVSQSASALTAEVEDLGRLLIRNTAALCAFIQQRILVSNRQRADRATLRRCKQPPHSPLVNVIQLRRTASRSRAADEHVETDWQCQWLVRGHWRQQWYPKLKRHQSKWITPYVKGPEDKPLKQPRATVFAVVR